MEIPVTPPRRTDPKEEELRRHGALNPRSGRVRDADFRKHAFFDRRDLVQVRYEMLRRHRKEEAPVAQAARDFGVTRQTFYEAAAAYDRAGIPGLVPRKRGPKGPHRCTPEILDYARRRRSEAPELRMDDLLTAVKDRFGVRLHRRTLERQLARFAKGGRPTRPPAQRPRPKRGRSK